MQVRDVSVTGEAKNDVIPFKAKTTQAQFSQQVDLKGLRVKCQYVPFGVSLESAGDA